MVRFLRFLVSANRSVPRFRALGFELRDFRVDAHDLPEGFDIDGLLGLSFLRQLNYEVRSGEGESSRLDEDRG